MLIYFDESYDNDHRYLLLGALFNPHPQYLNRRLTELKRAKNYVTKDGSLKEIKYNYCNTLLRYKICREVIDIFMVSTSWFRCIVIDQRRGFDVSYFGKPHEPLKIKYARAYKKFAELLIAHNTENIYNATLLADQLSRCDGDRFVELMKELFCQPLVGYSSSGATAILSHIDEVSSDLHQYQVLQVCDLLLGCILNELVPTKNKYKRMIRQYLIDQLGVDDLSPRFWRHYSKKFVQEYSPKFNIWYWKPK